MNFAPNPIPPICGYTVLARPWPIKKFVDKDAEFVFVPGEKVMAEQNASTPFPTTSRTSNSGIKVGDEASNGFKLAFRALSVS